MIRNTAAQMIKKTAMECDFPRFTNIVEQVYVQGVVCIRRSPSFVKQSSHNKCTSLIFQMNEGYAECATENKTERINEA